jgi:flagellar M-ring protein FliF
VRPAAQISQQNVFAITNLVASAVEGLGPESVSVVDMNGNLLNRPRRTGDNDSSQITSETLEARQQLERDLVAKIHSTLEPLIGPDRFRAGASVECDLTSGEQQEETFDPTHSVMVSSQKTEDVTDRAAATAGIPGTASNLPGGQAPKSAGGSGGLSRRTENVSFQTSRIVRQTHIPQGMIKRMSLSVLVDHTVQWEGTGAAKHRVLVPPTPETIQTIKDLVAAATGFNAGRGDQLIVESLPFESSLNAQPPAWLEFLRQNRDLMLPITLGVALLLFLLRAAIRLLTPRKLEKPEEVELPAQLPPSSRAPSSPQLAVEPVARAAANIAAGTPQDQSLEVAARVRQLAQSDLPLAANVLRLWLQESESRS